ncbi:MAG: hypothetical protein PCALPYG88_1945 [uncultured Paraburkholderia sp.]|nr:MAG: hypothetical protein PCALPYG88_1945 [uncultured Paraburkholderia sp.]
MQARLRHFLRVALAACFGRLLGSLRSATSLTYFASLFPAFLPPIMQLQMTHSRPNDAAQFTATNTAPSPAMRACERRTSVLARRIPVDRRSFNTTLRTVCVAAAMSALLSGCAVFCAGAGGSGGGFGGVCATGMRF